MKRPNDGGRGVPALVGREVEIATLVTAIQSDRSLIVVGEAGIGKTSLVRAGGAAAQRTLHEGGGFGTLRDVPSARRAR